MALGSTQPITEMSTRNPIGGGGGRGKGGWHIRLTTSSPSVSQLSRKCGSLDVLQLYLPSWPVTGIALALPTRNNVNKNRCNGIIGIPIYKGETVIYGSLKIVTAVLCCQVRSAIEVWCVCHSCQLQPVL
jgi:hypothetical protein